MTDATLLIAQISASLTTVMGILSLILMFTAARKLAKDSYRGFIMKSFFFLLFALIGVTAMTVYHFEEGLSYPESEERAEIWENLWYGFMFIAIIFSGYASLNIASFGKKFESISVEPSRVKAVKNVKTVKKAAKGKSSMKSQHSNGRSKRK